MTHFEDYEGDTWREQGLCTQVDPETFFPEKGGSNRDPKHLCNGDVKTPPCPVREDCLLYALTHPAETRYGVWGGKSERERRRMLRRAA